MFLDTVRCLAVVCLTLLSPVAFTVWARNRATRAVDIHAEEIWINSRRQARIVRLVVVAFWWAAWDLHNAEFFSSPSKILFFWIPPVLGVGVSQLIAYWVGGHILGQKWKYSDIARLTLWSTLSPTVAFVGVATASEAIYKGWWLGTVLLAVSGVVALIGNIQLRSAEGLKLRSVKSGRLYTRAVQLSKKMSVGLERVWIVPAGRGHLTNAYGGSRGIAVTDNYGKFTNGAQLDFIIGHELTHVKQKHGRRKLAVTLTCFTLLTLIFFKLPVYAWGLRPVIDLLILVVPTLALYFVSRRFEYTADRASLEITGNAETAITALANLYRMTGTPAECGRFVELFLTHPALSRRAEALARIGSICSDRVDEILGRSRGIETSTLGDTV